MADTVWITRHGNRQDFVDPDWPKTADRPYDPGLSPDGIEQAKLLAERMKREHISTIISSPFLRTVETAHYIAEAIDVPIFIEPGLSEWYNSEWFPAAPQTMRMDELMDRFPRVDPDYTACSQPHYGETEDEAMRRSGEAVHALAEAFDEPILLVGHGVSVAGAAAALDGETEMRECGFCCVFKIVRDENRWRMLLCADVSHLDENSRLERVA